MTKHHRILLSFGATALIASCDNNTVVPTAVTRTLSPPSRLVADSTSIPPQGPYVAIDLGTLGGNAGRAFDINNSGAIVGEARDSTGATHAFLWENGVMQDLGGLGGSFARAMRINDRGDIVGAGTTADSNLHAILWTGGILHDLGPIFGSTQFPGSVFLNQHGDVAWTRVTPTGLHAFLWQNGSAQDLGTLGGPTSGAAGINDFGMVIGTASTGTSTEAVIWSKGQVQVIPSPVTGASLSPRAINNRGWVTGVLQFNQFPVNWVKGVVWDGSTVTVIPILPSRGDSIGVGIAIDRQGAVYGMDFLLSGDFPHPYVWDRGTLSPLNPALTVQTITAVNDHGVATGQEPATSHSQHAIVLDGGTSFNLGVFSAGVQGQSEGVAINRHGDVVGFSTSSVGTDHPALWQRVP